MAGLIKGFVDRTLELKDQKATAASKAAKLAREQAKNLQTNLLKLYTPKSLSETQNYEGAKTALLNAGVNPLLIDASIQGAKSLSSTAEKKKTFDQTKSFLDQVKEGKIPAPNMANLLYALENPKSSPKSKKNAFTMLNKLAQFDWSIYGTNNFSSFMKQHGNAYKNKQLEKEANNLDKTDTANFRSNFSAENGDIGAHFVYSRDLLKDVNTKDIDTANTTKISTAHLTFLDKTEQHLATLTEDNRKRALENSYLKSAVNRSVQYLRSVNLEKISQNGEKYRDQVTDAEIFGDKKYLQAFTNTDKTAPRSNPEISIDKTHPQSVPLTTQEKEHSKHYVSLSSRYEVNEPTLHYKLNSNPISKMLFLNENSIGEDLINKQSTITGQNFRDEVKLKQAYTKWFNKQDDTNITNLIDTVLDVSQKYYASTSDNVGVGIIGVGFKAIHDLNPYEPIIVNGVKKIRAENKFEKYKYNNLLKENSKHPHKNIMDKRTKELVSLKTLGGDVDEIFTLIDDTRNIVTTGGQKYSLNMPDEYGIMGVEADVAQSLQNFAINMTGAIKSLVTEAEDYKKRFFDKTSNEHNSELNDVNRDRLSFLQEKMNVIKSKFQNAGNSKEGLLYKRRAIIQFRKLALTYRMSGLVQGEGTGGRTISNQDFEVMYNALWGTEKASRARLQALKDKINVMTTFANLEITFMNNGVYEQLAGASGKFTGFRRGLIKHYNQKYKNIDKKFEQLDVEEEQKLGKRQPMPQTPEEFYKETHDYLLGEGQINRNPDGSNLYKIKEGQTKDNLKEFIDARSKYITEAYQWLNPSLAEQFRNQTLSLEQQKTIEEKKKILDDKFVAYRKLGAEVLGEESDQYKYLFHKDYGRDEFLLIRLMGR